MLYLLKHVEKLSHGDEQKALADSLFKMKNNLCPPYLASLVSNNTGDVSRYRLRNVQHSQTVHAKSQLYFNSLLPSVVREWNAVPEATRELSTMACFTKDKSIKF